MTLYIRDDLGHAWYFDGERIRMVLADLELEGTDEFADSGYLCESLEDGISLLNEGGYISGVEYDNLSLDEYLDHKFYDGDL